MNYVFDPVKGASDKTKHGIPLELAGSGFSSPHVVEIDDRFAYNERRGVAFGFIAQRLFVCVFVDRDGDRRVMSLRKANAREVERYGRRAQQRSPLWTSIGRKWMP